MRTDANLNLLHSLNVLLDTCNLTQAAAQLGMTQSAMSRHLVQLRQQFNDQLLLRQGQRFILTERAEALRQSLKPALEQLDQLYQPSQFDPAQCQRRFMMAGSDYLAEYMFPDILDRVMAQAPQLRVSFCIWCANHYDFLVKEGLDLIATIASEVPENIYGKSLGQDHPVCVMAANHPLRDKPALSAQDYVDWQHVRISGASDKDGFIDQHLARAGLARDVPIDTPYFVSALSVVERSQLLLTLPEHMAARFAGQFNICAKPIPFVEHTYRYWLIWHARVDKDPAHRWFREHVYEVLYHSIHGVLHHDESAY